MKLMASKNNEDAETAVQEAGKDAVKKEVEKAKITVRVGPLLRIKKMNEYLMDMLVQMHGEVEEMTYGAEHSQEEYMLFCACEQTIEGLRDSSMALDYLLAMAKKAEGVDDYGIDVLFWEKDSKKSDKKTRKAKTAEEVDPDV